MRKFFAFNKTYFLLALLLFVVEVLIALYAHDAIVRPYVGDLLAVVWLYCVVRSFLQTPVLPTVLAVLLFAYLLEFLQYCQVLRIMGLEGSSIAQLLVGISFEWMDMVAYTVGAVLVVVVERVSRGPDSFSMCRK